MGEQGKQDGETAHHEWCHEHDEQGACHGYAYQQEGVTERQGPRDLRWTASAQLFGRPGGGTLADIKVTGGWGRQGRLTVVVPDHDDGPADSLRTHPLSELFEMIGCPEMAFVVSSAVNETRDRKYADAMEKHWSRLLGEGPGTAAQELRRSQS
jgi:hypothetical protein